MVLNLTFESPFSDVGVMPVVAFFICSTGPIMFVVYAIYEAYRYTKRKVALALKYLSMEQSTRYGPRQYRAV